MVTGICSQDISLELQTLQAFPSPLKKVRVDSPTAVRADRVKKISFFKKFR